ncbi:MAG: hypothetical protein IJK89_07445 [Clostridia bacterium]|nr:hypothetical protein [Clostridia bacterium]
MSAKGAAEDGKKLIKFTGIFFSVLVVYAFTSARKFELPAIGNVAYLFHCVDYSFGFCSKFLPGAVYGIFVDTPSRGSATVFETILLLLLLGISAFLLAKWYVCVRTQTEYGSAAMKLLLFFMTGSCTFAVFSCEIGMLDVYWLLFSILVLFLIQNRAGRFFIPVVMFLCVAVHYGAMLNYAPLFALLLLYEALAAEKQKEKKIWMVVFAVSCAAAAGAFVYFMIFDKYNIRYDIYTFDRLIKERGSEMTRYFDYALFSNGTEMDDYLKVSGNYDIFANVSHLFNVTEDSPFLLRLLDGIWFQIQGHLALYRSGDYNRVFIYAGLLLIVISPAVVILAGFILNRIKQTKNNTGMMLFYVCALTVFPITALCSVIISTDSIRWISHGFMSFFILILYIVFRGKGKGLAYFNDVFAAIPSFAFTVYFVIYALTVLDPYV